MFKVMFTNAAAATATAAALVAAPAMAQVAAGPEGAIQHFNQDFTGNEKVTILPETGSTGSTRTGVSEAQILFNQDYDDQDDLRPVIGQTELPSEPSNGEAILDRIEAEEEGSI